MNLKSLHRAQLKASIYKLLSCPGVLTDIDCFDVMTEIVDEMNEELGGNDA